MKINSKICFLTIFFYLVSMIGFSQPREFKVFGYIKGMDTGEVEISVIGYNNGQVKIDKNKIELKKGRFKFTGKIFYAFKARLIINNKMATNYFFIDTGFQQTHLIIDSIENPVTIKGSKANSEYLNEFQNKMRYFDEKLDKWYNNYWALQDKFNNKIPAKIEDSVQKNKQFIRQERDFALVEYAKFHKKSYVALDDLYENVYKYGYNSEREKTYYSFDKTLQLSATGVNLKKLLNSGKLTRVDSMFPNFQVIDSSDVSQYISVSMFKKYTLVDFWFSHCGPCIDQFEELNSIYSKFHSEGFEILGVSVDKKNDKADWKAAIKSNRLLWPQYWDINANEMTKLSLNFCPTNFLLDLSGKIIAKDLEPSQVRMFLEKNL